jgi:hypothetical protein
VETPDEDGMVGWTNKSFARLWQQKFYMLVATKVSNAV